MDVTSYLLGKQAGGGSEINNQNKDVTITTNGSTTVSADAGYTGLGTVGITTNVQPSLETLTETITENGTTTYTPSTGKDGFSSVSITTNVSGGGSEYFTSTIETGTATIPGALKVIKNVPDIQISGTTANYLFSRCANLVSIGSVTASGITQMQDTFAYCSSLVSAPLFDASSVINMNNTFVGCTALENLPLYNTSSLLYCNNAFWNCTSLTDTSLDNILQMYANATRFEGTKTFTSVTGLTSSQYPASRIQALPHYQDFIDAGWTIGY